jgi:hypothetical protein
VLASRADIKSEASALQELPTIAICLSYVRNLASSTSKEKKLMKRFLGAIALACVFSVSALAGELPTSGVTSPAPGELPTSGISSAPPTATSPGDLPTGGLAEQVSDAALSALMAVLGLVIV